jgi:hypothetical protein
MHRLGEQRLWIGGVRGPIVGLARSGPPCRRQGEQAVGLHAQHGHPAGHVLQLAIGLAPVEELAHLTRELCAAGAGRGLDQAADRLQFVGGKVTPAIALHELSMGGA